MNIKEREESDVLAAFTRKAEGRAVAEVKRQLWEPRLQRAHAGAFLTVSSHQSCG